VAIGDTDEIESKGAKRAAGANFIHSMDGVGGHLGMIALEAAKQNIQLLSIHDCFGCTAPQYLRLLSIVRDTFTQLHENDEQVLADILGRAKQDLSKDMKMPKLPKRGNQHNSETIRISHNMCK
jgi:DNA-directed RNA polymerase